MASIEALTEIVVAMRDEQRQTTERIVSKLDEIQSSVRGFMSSTEATAQTSHAGQIGDVAEAMGSP